MTTEVGAFAVIRDSLPFFTSTGFEYVFFIFPLQCHAIMTDMPVLSTAPPWPIHRK